VVYASDRGDRTLCSLPQLGETYGVGKADFSVDWPTEEQYELQRQELLDQGLAERGRCPLPSSVLNGATAGNGWCNTRDQRLGRVFKDGRRAPS